MPILLGAEFPPLRMGPELLVGQPDRPADLVGVRVDPVSRGRLPVVRPRGVLHRKREVLPGVGPVLPDQVCRRALMRPRQHPGEFSRLYQDRVHGEHEGGELGWNVRRGRRTRIVIAVQEPLVAHGPRIAMECDIDV
jgi:hypothetical protein